MGHALGWSQEYFRYVRPTVAEALTFWRAVARHIPHPELRAQALSSLATKHFHCEGGAIYGIPSRDPDGRLIRFIIPYQTLCDYLDTVTDRGPSRDPANLRLLHQSLLAAVRPDEPLRDYYALHPFQDDGGYIAELVRACQTALGSLPGFSALQPWVEPFARRYIDLQVFKHGPPDTRVPLLTDWAARHGARQYGLSWGEMAAAAGSTLGIFALLHHALESSPDLSQANALVSLYFPWLAALHILLDYFVDQEEDREAGDLNFVSDYRSLDEAAARLSWLSRQVQIRTKALPDGTFHAFIAQGLLGFYLADPKVGRPPGAHARRILAHAGPLAIGLYLAALVGRHP
ncbi:MAG: tetraprenyl-beta-curcumene synthase family protein [Firmicutes bacterium]|nr:tetraprenyl-beta-curcumene synthase family protein [Bacillota bacterium]